MTSERFSFAGFELDVRDRHLRRGGTAVDINGRYFDALTLLVRHAGQLVTKDRFMDDVWRGVPVTDEALTQCIRNLRRELGDDASRPRFIETVPKHGYRFIAPVDGTETPTPISRGERHGGAATGQRLRLGIAATAGAGAAGLIGGLFYGFVAAGQASGGGIGAASTVLVILLVTVIMAVIGGAGVAAGVAALSSPTGGPLPQGVVGGALGGLVVGGLFRLIGLDAFHLLLGRAPDGITGPFEGVMLGAAAGAGAWLAVRENGRSLVRAVAPAALIGALAGLAVTTSGGRLMAGSLDLLARAFPGSRLRLDPLARLLGESEFGPISAVVTGTAEAALFATCIAGAVLLARRHGTS